MTSKKELDEIAKSGKWPIIVFIDKYLNKRKSEINIINSLYDLYSFYPEFISTIDLYNNLWYI